MEINITAAHKSIFLRVASNYFASTLLSYEELHKELHQFTEALQNGKFLIRKNNQQEKKRKKSAEIM